MTLDEIRRRYPAFGFAVYAYEPGGPVTVEVHADDGSIFTGAGASESEALDNLFGGAPAEDQFPDDNRSNPDHGHPADDDPDDIFG